MANPVPHQSSAFHRSLRRLIRTPGLDGRVRDEPALAGAVRERLQEASELAWSDRACDDDREPLVAAAQLETQRALYELNRLHFYWFDDPAAYTNESSHLLFDLHQELEAPWQRWLARRLPFERPDENDPGALLQAWARRDLTASDRAEDWFGEQMNLAGYRALLQVASLNGLVEASQLSRVLGGASHPAQGALFRILMEEYGAGRPHKKHSYYFARMLEGQGLSAEPEAYFERVPWQVLSAINHSFYLTENRRHYLRFCGAFTYTELSTPLSFRGYAAAVERLGLSDGRSDYWALHVREDERHGAWMLEEVALPLLAQFPMHRHDLLLGYVQQRAVERMAGAATERVCRAAQAGDT